MKKQWLVGIDEAGRGPLAGPIAVGVACVPFDFAWERIPEVNDSKKLTPSKREWIFSQAQALKREKQLSYAVSLIGAATIDRIGIVLAIQKAMQNALTTIQSQLQFDASACSVKLDGSLYAPKEFVYQETIIKGDAKEKIIGLASVLAKVTRDRYMVQLASKEKYVPYDFHIHKGYGTKSHREAILSYGLSDIHRAYFCQKLIKR